MNTLRTTIAATALAAVTAAGFAPGALADGSGRFVEVAITNVTGGQIISPVVVASHSGRLDPVFELGSPASEALAAAAEDAVLGPLVDALEADSAVRDVQTIFGENGPILPGETAYATLELRGSKRLVSLVGMLVTTNDAFVGLDGVPGPTGRAVTYRAAAYDAGSEVNNESCDFIPGPPCGNGGVRATEGAEGYVYVHSGIHGVGDLVPAVHDWRNPVAVVTLRRVSDHDDD